MPFESLYCATKFALRGFCLSLREELRPAGIEVNLISPGPVETEMLRTESTCDRSTITFVEHPLAPGDVADAILRMIRKPSPEVVLPARTKLVSLLMGIFPSLFTAAYPFLDLVGGLRLKRYRKRLAPLPPLVSREPLYE